LSDSAVCAETLFSVAMFFEAVFYERERSSGTQGSKRGNSQSLQRNFEDFDGCFLTKAIFKCFATLSVFNTTHSRSWGRCALKKAGIFSESKWQTIQSLQTIQIKIKMSNRWQIRPLC
jgi:hypothetical protein